jgi:hypothetical protein
MYSPVALEPPLAHFQTEVMSSRASTQSSTITYTALDPAPPNEILDAMLTSEVTLRAEDNARATSKDLRFWLVIMGLLVATFLAALDLTGKIYLLNPRSTES